MSAALRLVSEHPVRPVPKAPPAPPAPAPGHEPYCLGQPVDALRSRVEMARELLALTGRPFDWDSAVADYMAETDEGRPEQFGLDDRAERWGWVLSKSTMHARMKRVREDAFDRADLYRTKRERPAAERQPNSRRTQPNSDRTESEQKQPAQTDKARSAEREPNAAEQPPNAAEQHIHRIARGIPHTQTSEDGDAAEARARARIVLEWMGLDDTALVAEAQDRAAEADRLGDVPVDLPRLALCLGLTGQVPHQARDALAALAPPDAATLLVVVLRTGDRPRTGPRTNYLRTLASSLADHDRSDTYAGTTPDPGANRSAGRAVVGPDAQADPSRRRHAPVGHGSRRPVGTAAERASGRTVAGTLALLDEFEYGDDGTLIGRKRRGDDTDGRADDGTGDGRALGPHHA